MTEVKKLPPERRRKVVCKSYRRRDGRLIIAKPGKVFCFWVGPKDDKPPKAA